MSGDSPGRGHPGWGSSPSKAQAPRPNLGSNTQANRSVDVNPNVSACGISVSSTGKEKKEEATDESLVRQPSNVRKESPVCKTKMVENESLISVHEGSPVQASGGQSTSTPGSRHRRTSLERQTIQQNLQQRVMMTSERTRSGSVHAVKETRGSSEGSSTGAAIAAPRLGTSRPSGDCDPQAAGSPTCTASRQPDNPSSSKQRPPEQERPPERAAELHLAEQIPGLVRRMEALRKHKLHLQRQIDCTYKLKAANPGKQVLLDKKLDSLAKELADNVQEMDSVMEEMGPVGETYRNQERFHRDQNSPKTSRPETLQSHVRPILQPATFPYERGLHKTGTSEQRQPGPAAATSEELQVPAVSTMHNANCELLPDGSSEGVVQAPQVPGDSALQRDCGLTPQVNTAAAPGGICEQDTKDCAVQGVHAEDCAVQGVHAEDCAVQEVHAEDCNVADMSDISVCDNAPAEESSMAQPMAAGHEETPGVDGGEGTGQSNAEDFPPLVTQPAAEPHNPGQQQPTHPPQPGGGQTSGNAWSRGSPHFSSNTSYTGQAFKRRNVVRFKHKGAKEDLPDRRRVVRDMLCHQMGFLPTNILPVINLPDRQGYDVSFKLMSDLDRFWAQYTRLRDTEGWDKFSFVPISKPDTVNVTIIFWNESVPPQDIIIWLRRHCELKSNLTKTKDEDGIWTGGWRVLVRLHQHQNITHHLPNSFFIGREKGACFYAGQPRLCFKCGKPGHIASVCTMVKCSLCGDIGHVSATCHNIKCNLCGKMGHAHRDCPEAFHNTYRDIPDQDLLEAADVPEEEQEEEALFSGSLNTVPETPQMSDLVPDPPQTQNTEGDMEVAEQSVETPAPVSAPDPANTSEGSKVLKKRKKNKTSRKPEGEWTTVQKPSKMRVERQTDVMVTANRYGILSESDGEDEIEQELKRMMEECDDDPPTKKRPLHDESIWDMETGSQQDNSDCD